ncbi:hypothetical protein [Kocuria rosea]|uniref:hypothetical protein n=1 Tax=Kocuria rosea TaxID=1275 RepID=UPI002330FAF1|nr:hypothetical protein [Kocuria rosea]
MTATTCTCTPDPADRERVDFMIRTARTKEQLQDLVRALDARNVRLQRVRDQLGTALAQARLDTGKTPPLFLKETQND